MLNYAQSLRKALKRLGYIDSYHGFSVLAENPLDGAFWLEANCPRLGKTDGRDFDRSDWDQLLGHCQAVLDFPSVCFSEELMAAYPTAKVILSSRDEDGWVRSMKTIYHSFQNPGWRLRWWWNERIGGEWKWAGRVADQFCVQFYGEDLEVSGRRVFREQEDLVRRLCADTPGRLLEWKVQDGWEPLCEFLGEEVPDVEFPSGNDTKGYWERMEKHNAFMGRDWKARQVWRVIDNWAPISLATFATAVAAVRFFRGSLGVGRW